VVSEGTAVATSTKRARTALWIASIGTYVPAEMRDNAYYARTTGLTEENLVRTTGISTRRIARPGEDAFTMALAAAKSCLTNAELALGKPDLIVSGSYTPSDLIGTIAHRLQRALDLKNARAVYLSTACSSMLNAIEIAEGYFATGKSKFCLATASEHNSLYNDESDPSSGHLWGDGAGAFLLSNGRPSSGRGLEVLSLITRAHATDGHGPDAIYMRPRDGGLKMPRGTEVFRQAVRKMISISHEAIAAAGLSIADIRYLIPHQANQRITDAVSAELGFQPEQVASTISKYGNTGCASVVLALAEVAGKLRDGDHALLVTFGGGYSSAAMVVRAKGATSKTRPDFVCLNGSNGSNVTAATDAAAPERIGPNHHDPIPYSIAMPSAREPLLGDEDGFIAKLVEKKGPEVNDYAALNRWFLDVHDKCSCGLLSNEEAIGLRKLFGAAMSAATLQGFVCHQPHGYPGDFEIIDRIYTTHLSPRPELMRWDAFFHAQKATKAVRNRKQYFHGILDSHYAVHQPLRVLKLGSGSGRCMFEWLSSREHSNVSFHCVELDPDAILYASLLNQPFTSQIAFERRNVVRFVPAKKFHLIWAAGLFDYFSDKVFQFLLRRLLPAIAAGGELVIGNFTSDAASRAYMEFGGWKLHTRSKDELVHMAKQCGVEAARIRVDSEPEGLNLFLHVAS